MSPRPASRNNPWRYALLVVLMAVGATACGENEEIRSIALVNTLDSLDAITDSLKEQLLASNDAHVEFLQIDSGMDLEEAIDDILEKSPDVVVSLTTPVSLSVGSKTLPAGVPHVFGMVTDPVGSDLVETTMAPGRNRTGVGLLQIQQTLDLTVRVAGARSVAVLHQQSDPASVSGLALAERAAAALDVELLVMDVPTDGDLAEVLAAGPPADADAFLIVGSPFAARNLRDISEAVADWRILSASALTVDAIPAGFTLGVAPDSQDIARLVADRVLAILNGASAAAIPVGIADNVALIDLDEANRRSIDVADDALIEFDSVLGGA